MNTRETNTVTEAAGYNALPGRLEIITERNAFRSVATASEAFRALRLVESLKDPLLALWWIDRQGRRFAAEPAHVGALNIYLGTVGLRGLSRTLGQGRARPCTRWDLARLFAHAGFAFWQEASTAA